MLGACYFMFALFAALETPENADIVRAVQAAAGNMLHSPLPVAGAPFWTDAALLSAAGIPSVLLGLAGSGAHTDEEWIDLASVQKYAEMYLAAAMELCN